MKVTRKTFDEVMMPCYVPQDMVLTHGKGCFLYDSEDNEYLDMTAGIAVNCLGHNHPQVVKTIKKQAERLIHVSNIFVNDKTLTLAKKLVSLTGYERVFFVNSGAEANEAALKLARRVAFDNYGEQKCEIISFEHSFHGRTFFSVSVGGQAKYYQGFGPIPGGITHLPFNDLESFKKTVSDNTCAVIVEVVQGEGGIIEIDPEFLQGVRELCTKHNALLIFDEVQTGVGRLGSFYGYEQVGVKPDILTSAKGLAAGLPIGAILTYDHIAAHFKPGTHGSTFGGNPLACAVGCKVVDLVSDQDFLDKVSANGQYLREQLGKLNKKYSIFADIRGKGLLVGAQLAEPYVKDLSLIQKLCTKHQLLVLVAGYDVLRFAPPLIITKSEIRKAIKLLEAAIIDYLSYYEHNQAVSDNADQALASSVSDVRQGSESKEKETKAQEKASPEPQEQKLQAPAAPQEPQNQEAQAKENTKSQKGSSAKQEVAQAVEHDLDEEDEQSIAIANEVIASFDSLESLANALINDKPSDKDDEVLTEYMEQMLNLESQDHDNSDSSKVEPPQKITAPAANTASKGKARKAKRK